MKWLILLPIILLSCQNPSESDTIAESKTGKANYLFTNLSYYVYDGSNIGNISNLTNFVIIDITSYQADSICRSSKNHVSSKAYYTNVFYKRLN
jgi:hypothetical protein